MELVTTLDLDELNWRRIVLSEMFHIHISVNKATPNIKSHLGFTFTTVIGRHQEQKVYLQWSLLYKSEVVYNSYSEALRSAINWCIEDIIKLNEDV